MFSLYHPSCEITNRGPAKAPLLILFPESLNRLNCDRLLIINFVHFVAWILSDLWNGPNLYRPKLQKNSGTLLPNWYQSIQSWYSRKFSALCYHIGPNLYIADIADNYQNSVTKLVPIYAELVKQKILTSCYQNCPILWSENYRGSIAKNSEHSATLWARLIKIIQK